MNKKYKIMLSDIDRKELEKIISKGLNNSRVITRARVLLLSDNGKSQVDIADFLKITNITVSKICKKYVLSGLQSSLYDKNRTGKPPRITGLEEAKIIALACSKSPEGYQRWSLRLLADKAVELNLIDSISHRKVRDILKKTNLSLT